MRRREFITLLSGAALTSPLAARAQQSGGMRRIGVLGSGRENDPVQKSRLAAFQQGLDRLGWSDGSNVRIDYRYAAGSTERFQPLAKELVALQPDVILAQTTGIVAALKRETSTIPIVFTNVSDPIGSGFAASLAQPGGNLTGLLLFEASIVGKWMSMLKEIAPGFKRVALMANPKATPFDYFLRAAEIAASSLAIELVPSRVETAADIERAIASFARVPNTGLVVLPDPTNTLHRDLIVALAARHRLPAVYSGRDFITAGGLMSYETDRIDILRQAASYVDRILRGAKPADLPVELASKFDLIINLATAKAIDFEIPPTLLARADEVIE